MLLRDINLFSMLLLLFGACDLWLIGILGIMLFSLECSLSDNKVI